MPLELLQERPGLELERGGPAPPPGTGRDDGRPDGPEGILGDPARFGVLAFLTTVSMLFVGFTSAYIVRRAGTDWQPLAAPPLLYLSTGLLLASSAALEAARHRLRDWNLEGSGRSVAWTGVLGLAFVLAQLGAWGQLAARGVFLASNPHSSFFYLLTGVHVLHVAGGLVWFLVVASRVRRLALSPGENGLGLFAIYWHFLAGLWLYLLLLLFVL